MDLSTLVLELYTHVVPDISTHHDEVMQTMCNLMAMRNISFSGEGLVQYLGGDGVSPYKKLHLYAKFSQDLQQAVTKAVNNDLNNKIRKKQLNNH